jgi:hypothetical protein
LFAFFVVKGSVAGFAAKPLVGIPTTIASAAVFADFVPAHCASYVWKTSKEERIGIIGIITYMLPEVNPCVHL